jgi:hypothetical protein
MVVVVVVVEEEEDVGFCFHGRESPAAVATALTAAAAAAADAECGRGEADHAAGDPGPRVVPRRLPAPRARQRAHSVRARAWRTCVRACVRACVPTGVWIVWW